MTSLGDTRDHSSLSATYADRIRELISEDRIAGARKLLKEGLEANPRDPHLNRLQGLLALPKTTKVRFYGENEDDDSDQPIAHLSTTP